MKLRGAALGALIVACGAGALGVGCGGGGLGSGGALRHTLPEKHLVTVPLEDQEIFLPAKQDLDRALLERDQLESRRAAAKTRLDVAKNEEREAKIGLSSARSMKKAAAGGVDRNQQNDAARQERVADLRLRNARAKRAFYEAKKQWVDRAATWARAQAFAREARYELEKAKVASARNIRPSGFKLAEFDAQATERVRRATDLRKGVDDARRRAEEKRAEWIGKESEYRKTLGQAGAPEASAEQVEPVDQAQVPTSGSPAPR